MASFPLKRVVWLFHQGTSHDPAPELRRKPKLAAAASPKNFNISRANSPFASDRTAQGISLTPYITPEHAALALKRTPHTNLWHENRCSYHDCKALEAHPTPAAKAPVVVAALPALTRGPSHRVTSSTRTLGRPGSFRASGIRVSTALGLVSHGQCCILQAAVLLERGRQHVQKDVHNMSAE